MLEVIGGADRVRTDDLMNDILVLVSSSKKRCFVLTCVFTCYYSDFRLYMLIIILLHGVEVFFRESLTVPKTVPSRY